MVTKKDMLKILIDASEVKDKEKAMKYGIKRKAESIARCMDFYLAGQVTADFAVHVLTGLINASNK